MTRTSCWGGGTLGDLGNGTGSESDVPVPVKGVGGVGLLSGVVSLGTDGAGYCAVLGSGGVDCWGLGSNGTANPLN